VRHGAKQAEACVGLDGVAHKRRNLGKGLLDGLNLVHEVALRINVERRTQAISKRLDRHVFAEELTVFVVESVHGFSFQLSVISELQ
jgi:hypothetical protein